MKTYIVNEPSKNIRTLAREAMKGKWKSAALALLIYAVCIIVPTIIIIALFGGFTEEVLMSDELMMPGEGLSTIYSILVGGAFTFGITVYFLDLIREKKSDIGQVFSGFGFYFKTLLLYAVMSIFIVLWSLLLIVPGIIAAFRYSQAFYILADDPSKDIMQCLNESKEMMKGNKAKYFCLELSFIGWYLLVYAVIVLVSTVSVSVMMFLPGSISTVVGFVGLGAVIIAAVVGAMFLMAYVMAATTVFYEMANGNLRPQSDDLPPLSQAVFENTPQLAQENSQETTQTVIELPETEVYDNDISVNDDKTEM